MASDSAGCIREGTRSDLVKVQCASRVNKSGMPDVEEKEEAGLREPLLQPDVPEHHGPTSFPKEAEASWLSRILFCWMNPYIWTGFKRRLEVTDRLTPPPYIDQEELYRCFEPMWRAECSKPEGKRSLAGVLWRLYRWRWLGAFVFCCVSYSLLMLGPLITRRLILFLRASQGPSPPPLSDGLALVGVLLCVNICDALIKSASMYHIKMVGNGLRALLLVAVFRKGLVLAPSAWRATPVSRLVNMVSSEASWLLNVFPGLMNLLCAPLMVLAISVVIYILIGPCIAFGLCVMLAYMPLMSLLARRQKDAQADKQRAADERIKVIKLYAWSGAMASRLTSKRTHEAKALTSFSILRAASVALTTLVPLLSLLCTFGSYYALHGRSPALEDVYTVIALFKLLVLPFKTCSEGITSLASLQVALTRFQRFLELPEGGALLLGDRGSEVGLSIRGDFAWEGGQGDAATLRGLDLKVRRGELVAVVGAVGSGKSSLISAAIGEIDAVGSGSGSEVNGHVALVAQQAFITNSSVRENVLLGSAMDLSRYQRTLRCCALLPDLSMLPHGDATLIGSKGINLSGGQRARLSLARACYSDADVILLDDPLSAVDAHVAAHLWQHLLVEEWGHKTVLLTTNQLSLLTHPRVSRIIVLQQGTVVQEGSFAELMSCPLGPFASLAKSLHLKQQHQQEGEDEGKTQPPTHTTTHHTDAEASAVSGSGGLKQAQRQRLESRHEGAVGLSTYLTYLGAFQCAPYVAIMLALFLVVEGVTAGQDWFLGQWATDGLRLPAPQYFKWYGIVMAALCGLVLLRGLLFAGFSIKAASAMHDKAAARLLRAPMTFLDTTPIGQILNRFSQDVNGLDVDLPTSLEMFLITWCRVLDVVAVACLPQPLVAVALLPLLIAFHFLKELYRRSSRESQRLYLTTWSPVLGVMEQTLSGLMTLRAYGAQDYADTQFAQASATNASFAFAKAALDQWIFTQLSFLCALVMSGSALGVILTRDHASPALAGLAFSSTLTLIVELRFGVRFATAVEAQLNSVDRLQEYSTLPQEAPAHLPSDDQLPSDWPQAGKLHFKHLSLRYRPELPQVLRGLEACVEGGSKVGIVGRTGSGKSSLLLGLFRLIEPDQGTVELDGVDIRTLGLDRLRRVLAIVPQDPVMFSGSVRANLDPFGEYGDDQVWWALDRCGMGGAVRRLCGGLHANVEEAGANFSVGERQLLCMGRALLRRARVLVLDEATASVDPATDQLIQTTIRESFVGCTVVAVAHRVRTVLDYDKIMVLDNGVLREFGSPQELLARGVEGSVFASMAHSSGIDVHKSARGSQ